MKKLIVIAILVATSTLIAQERNGKQQRSKMTQFSLEQRNQLKLKEMTLHLDLNEEQQKEMSSVIFDLSKKKEVHKNAMKSMREKGVKPSPDELFAMKNNRLDEQIALKKRMKLILNTKQFEKWEHFQATRNDKMKNRMEQSRQKNKEGKF